MWPVMCIVCATSCVFCARLFDRTCDLLEANVALASMGELLTEVFTGGPEICLMVREEHVEKIFNVINSETEGRAELISALQAIAKVKTEESHTQPHHHC